MQYSQQMLYSINLPNFLIEFKNKCNQMIVPYLIEFKNYINEEGNNSTVHPVITIVTIFIVLYSIHAVFKGLFGNSSSCNDPNHKNNSTQSQQLNRQLNDLKKQLKGLYVSFKQLSKQVNNKKSKQNTNIEKIQQNSSNLKNQQIDENLLKLWKQFVPIYNNSIQNNKKLALYILQTQQQVFLQLKKLKKNNRLSSSSGRPSTVRSKTSDKKLFSSQMARQKKSLPLTPLITLKQNIIQPQPLQQSPVQLPKSKQKFNNNSGQSTSTLSATVLPLNNQHSDSNNSVDEPEKKILQTPVVVKVPMMKNVKPPLPKAIKPIPPKNIQIQNVDQNRNNEEGLIKRNEGNINLNISPLKIQQKQNSFKNIDEINNVIKAEQTERNQVVIDKNQKKTEKKTIQSPQQIKHIKQEQQVNQSVVVSNNFTAPSFQNEEIPVTETNENQQNTNQPLAPPKIMNIKKPTPPSKMNTGRRAPPPPPTKK